MAERINIVRQGAVAFDPPVLTVAANDRVFWCNLDPDQPHRLDVFPDDPQFELAAHTKEPPAMSPQLLVRETVEYSCRRHPQEKGRIVVE